MLNRNHLVKGICLFIFICLLLSVFCCPVFAGAGAPAVSMEDEDLKYSTREENLDQKEIARVINIVQNNFYKEIEKEQLADKFVEGIKEKAKKEGDEKLLKSLSEQEKSIAIPGKLDKIFENSNINNEKKQKYYQAGLNKMVESLDDPSCEYYAPGEYRQSLSEMGYNKGGCGFFADEDPDTDGRFIVIETLRDFPAEKQGLKPGDRIVKVDGKSVKGFTFHNLADVVRGPIGSEVIITVFRPTLKKEVDIKIKRTWLAPNANSLSSKVIDDNVGYVKFRFLGTRIIFDLEEIDRKFKQKKVEAVIWDMRNSAGRIKGGLELAAHFVPEKHVFIKKIFREGDEELKGTDSFNIRIPRVILMNNYTSASCAIVALVLNKFHNVTLVGRPCEWETDLSVPHRLKDGSVITISYGYYKLPGGQELKSGTLIKPEVDVGQHPLPPFDEGDKQLRKALELIKK